MQVEVYDMRELNSETLQPEPDQEAIDLARELGLEGQLSRVKSDGTIDIRHGYEVVTDDQQAVMEELFGAFTAVDRYDDGPIPVRVLKEIAFAREHFDHLLVIHAPGAQIDDPILVGVEGAFYGGTKGRSREVFGMGARKVYLIARWGDALQSWAELARQAEQAARTRLLAELRSASTRIATAIALLVQGAQITDRRADIDPHLPISL